MIKKVITLYSKCPSVNSVTLFPKIVGNWTGDHLIEAVNITVLTVYICRIVKQIYLND